MNGSKAFFFFPYCIEIHVLQYSEAERKDLYLISGFTDFHWHDFELAVAQVQVGYFIIWHKNTLQYRNHALDLLLKDPEIFSFWGAARKVFQQLSPVFQQNSYRGFIS